MTATEPIHVDFLGERVAVKPLAMMNKWEFQFHAARILGGPVLNAACAEDGSGLGDKFDATNLDIQIVDDATGHDHRTLKNFVHGSVLKMPFERQTYKTVVLGEFLEHCTFDAAVAAITECRRVLFSGGYLAMTIPLDVEPLEEHTGTIAEYDSGITPYHQTLWSPKRMKSLIEKVAMVVTYKKSIIYPEDIFGDHPKVGWGIVLKNERP